MKLADRIFKRNDWKMTSPFGNRKHPVTGEVKLHSGTDYGTQGQKWKQYALEDGVVISAGVDKAGYNALYAWVSYPRLGIKLLHYHLDEVFVKKNQKVTHDTVIGTTGTSGLSTGIHLHLGIKHLSDDKYFDPESYDYIPAEEVKPVQTVQADPSFKVGNKVKITGTIYATGQAIPLSIRVRTFTIQEVKSDKALLKEIVSWVYLKDLRKV